MKYLKGGTALIILTVIAIILYRRDVEQRAELQAIARDVAGLRAMSTAGAPVMLPVTAPSCDVDAVAERTAARISTRTSEPAAAPEAESTPAPPTAEAPAPRSEEQIAAFTDAWGVLDDAVARGRLHRDDVLAIRHQLAAAHPDDVQELARHIAVAINTNKLVPEDPRFIFP